MQTTHLPVVSSIFYDTGLELHQIRLIGLFNCKAFNIQGTIKLALSDRYLLYFQDINSITPSHFCTLGFDLKFDIIRQLPWKDEYTPNRPVGIRLEKELANKTFQVLQLTSQDTNQLYAWKTLLESKINQRSFHSLFKAKKQIGKGAFATVYLAERLEDKKLVAVKAFSKQRQYSGEQGRQSLINQITLMRKINHPNVIRLQGVFQTQNSIYVILQILEGRQLYDRLKNNQIKGQREVLQITRNILNALKALAEKRVIHRDLKPQNIMFRKEGSNDLVICDFGLATFADQDKYLFVRCGTPGFVAPQIINIRDMTTKSEPISDVFSAGLIFHYLIFGKSIFEGKRYQEILGQNRACCFNFEKEIYRNLDKTTLDLLKKLLEVDPRARITATEALKHPFFDVSRFDMKTIVPKLDYQPMIDEKDENMTLVTARSKKIQLKNLQNNSQHSSSKNRRSSYRGSLYCDKENEGYQVTCIKRGSFVNQLEAPMSKRVRNTTNQRKVNYHAMRS